MSDFIPKPKTAKVGGLSRKAQKLQAALEKAEQGKGSGKQAAGVQAGSVKGKDSFANTKKTTFQRKAV